MKINSNLKIEIRPIPDRSRIRQFSENLEYFSKAHILSPFVNPKTLKYATGLSKEDIKYLQEQEFPYDISDTWIRGVAHKFWESPMVEVDLVSKPSFLYPGRNLIDFIKYKYLLVSRYIYKSEVEMLNGTKPEATHFIYDESEAIDTKAVKVQRKNEIIGKIKDLSLKRKRDIILILTDEVTDNKNENYLTVKFDEILSDKELSIGLEELLNKDSDDLSVTAEIKVALKTNVLRKTKTGIFYFETNLGFSEEDVKKSLLDPENQELYINIKSKI